MSEMAPVPHSHSPPHSSPFLRGRPSPCSTKVTLIFQDTHPQVPSGHPPAHVLSGPSDTRPAHSPRPGRFTVPSEEPSSRMLFPTLPPAAPASPHPFSLRGAKPRTGAARTTPRPGLMLWFWLTQPSGLSTLRATSWPLLSTHVPEGRSVARF